MNKMIKGSVAGATGIVLLMGGFGTYALWSDSTTMDQSSITSGELDIAAGAVAWDDTSTLAADDWTLGTDLVVPGDVITRTQTFALKGTGKNLTGRVDFAQGAVNEGGFSQGGPSAFDWLTVSVDITSDVGAVTETTPGSNNFTFASPFDTANLTAVVTYTVGDATAQQAQNATAVLADSTLTIAQN